MALLKLLKLDKGSEEVAGGRGGGDGAGVEFEDVGGDGVGGADNVRNLHFNCLVLI